MEHSIGTTTQGNDDNHGVFERGASQNVARFEIDLEEMSNCLGRSFALVDFGSGFTSYAHLKNLRTDTLKIDGSFVKDMLNNPGDYAMVKSMNDIGHSLGLRTVAEYVESPMILHALREIGVDYAQGYAVHKPCRIDEMLRYESV